MRRFDTLIEKLNRISRDCKFRQTFSHLSLAAFISFICTPKRLDYLCACMHEGGREEDAVECASSLFLSNKYLFPLPVQIVNPRGYCS